MKKFTSQFTRGDASAFAAPVVVGAVTNGSPMRLFLRVLLLTSVVVSAAAFVGCGPGGDHHGLTASVSGN